MLTLNNPEIIYLFTDIHGRLHRRGAWIFMQDMMERVFNLSQNHQCFMHNGAGDKAATFFRLAEFVRKCQENGSPSVRITQDNTLRDPSRDKEMYYWRFTCDEETSTVTVSENLMAVLINIKEA
jgi:hypothetical protein